MLVEKIDKPRRAFLESLKVPSAPGMKGYPIFIEDEINYLVLDSTLHFFEFTQEYGESRSEFYENFIQWMQEEVFEGYIDAYILFYLNGGNYYSGKRDCLTPDELARFEQTIPGCFEKGRVWFHEMNYRHRNRFRILLICCAKRKFRRFIPKTFKET